MKILNYFDLAELKKIVRLAIPILLGSMATIGMEITDTIMSGHVSSQDLAGISIAAIFIITITLSCNGFILATTPTIAKDHGSANYSLLHRHFYQIVYIALGLTVISAVILVGTSFLFYVFDLEDRVRTVALWYTYISLIGILPFFLFSSIRSLTEGMSYTKLTMYVSFIALIINGVLNYIFMFGKLGMPALGGIGSAIATVIVQFMMVIVQWLTMKKIKHFKQLNFSIKDFKPDFAILVNFIKVGFPISIALFFEIAFFTFLGCVVTYMGTMMMAANQIYYNLMTILYMLPFSLSQVVSIRIGYSFGKNNLEQTKKTIITGYIFGIGLALITASTSYICRDFVGYLYTDDLEVISIVASSFAIVSLYQLADFCQITSIGVLRGLQDNKIISFSSVLVYWLIGIPCALILGFTDLLGGPYGFGGLWTGLCVSLYVLAVVYTLKVISNMKKLEYFRERMMKQS